MAMNISRSFDLRCTHRLPQAACRGKPCSTAVLCAPRIRRAVRKTRAFGADDHLDNTTSNSEDSDACRWASDNVASGQLYSGDAYSHHLPWKEYTRAMFWAMEAEVESKQELRAAYGQPSNTWQQNGPSKSGTNAFTAGVGSDAQLLPTSEFTKKLHNAVEAHKDAVHYREVAEAAAQKFFSSVKASHDTWVATEREYARSATIEIDEALHQGMQMAKDKWIEALRAARELIKSTQQALATCAAKIHLEMTMQPQGAPMRKKQEAALHQLQELRYDTMSDLAAAITARFLPSCDMSTAEARQWLEKVWHLQDNKYDKDDNSNQ